MLLHQFDLTGSPALVEPWLQGAVKAKDGKPGFEKRPQEGVSPKTIRSDEVNSGYDLGLEELGDDGDGTDDLSNCPDGLPVHFCTSRLYISS